MFELVHHALLVGACSALGAAALRIAAGCGADGLLRIVAAAPLAVAAAVAQALVLGRVGLSSSTPALVALALATWLVTRALVPVPAERLADRFAAWWTEAPRAVRWSLGAAGGAWSIWVLWQLRFPHIDLDGLIYHLPLAVAWAPDGDAGSVVPLIEGLPVGNYPLTNEVALSWALGIADGLAWISVWTPMLWSLAAVAGWTGLRALGVPRAVAALALAAVLTMPTVVGQLGSPLTDLAAFAWTATAATLCLHAAARPALLGPAIVAVALAVGTKTTPAPVLAVLLAVTLWSRRDQLRPLAARVVGPAVALGVLVGGAWMIRNTLSHGWPLWPFQSGPVGDEMPPALAAVDARFIDDPGGMLSDGRIDDYGRVLGGGAALLVAVLVLPVLSAMSTRSRRALAFAAVALFGVFAWMNAPFTGIKEPPELAVGFVRYLLPALACAAVALAVAGTRAPTWLRRTTLAVLGLALVLSVAESGELGFPYVPSAATVLLGAVVGVAFAWLAPPVIGRVGRLGAITRVGGAATLVAAVGAVGATTVLASHSQGYLIRHSGVETIGQGIIGAFIRDPAFRADERRRVSMGPITLGTLAGERVQHELDLIPPGESCERTRARRDEGWVVAQVLPDTPTAQAIVACMQGLPEMFRDRRYVVWTAPSRG